jgi:hypothetical protein
MAVSLGWLMRPGKVHFTGSERLVEDGWGVARRRSMCLSCGCGEPNDNHGDDRHITLDMLQQAAEAAEVSPEEAVNNMVETFRRAQEPQ